MVFKSTDHQVRKSIRKISKVSNDATPKDENRIDEKAGLQRAIVKKIDTTNLSGNGWYVEYVTGGSAWVSVSTQGIDSLPEGDIENGILYPNDSITVDVVQDSSLRGSRIIATRNTTLDSNTEPGTTQIVQGDSQVKLTNDNLSLEAETITFKDVDLDDIINKDNLEENVISIIEAAIGELTILTLSNIYPVGHVYISVNSTNPSTFLGGTWIEIEQTTAAFQSASLSETIYVFKRTV